MSEQSPSPTKILHKEVGSPLPIQKNLPLQTKSLFEFVEAEVGAVKQSYKIESEALGTTSRQFLHALNKKNIHQIGDRMDAIFSKIVYISHQYLATSTNADFASCKVDLQDYEKSKANDQTLSKDYGGLKFQSRFQSGNLAIASRVPQDSRSYFLALQRDINSSSPTSQWFYFKVSNGDSNLGVFTFQIVNFIKAYSNFKNGMKICVLSNKKAGKGWLRGCTNIDYRRNSIPLDDEKQRSYYTLSFSYEFSEKNQEVYFAYCYPYTYTRLVSFLDNVEHQKIPHQCKLRRKTLAKTSLGNSVQQISITNSNQYKDKKVIYIVGRVHPGETISSYICESIIMFLLSSHEEARQLRNQFFIKIVPMLNPDGVVVGNYRTSLSGDDLNRVWKNPDKNLHPEIFALKKSIFECENKKALFIDLHCHSKKKSSFMYGCVNNKQPFLAKELPYLISKKCSFFSYALCNFTTPKSKQGTSRIAIWKGCQLDNSYTFEVSFCGPNKEKRHFGLRDYELIGVELIKCVANYFYSRILQLEVNEEVEQAIKQFYTDQEIMAMGGDDTHGSSSQLQDEVIKEHREIQKKAQIVIYNEKQKEKVLVNQSKQLGNIIQHKLFQTTTKIRKPISLRNQNDDYQQSRQLLKDKKLEQKQKSYMKQRQSFMATKINIQQINVNDGCLTLPLCSNVMLSTFYGLSVDRSARSSHDKQIQFDIINRIGSSHYLQAPKRSASLMKSQESLGILLPSMQKLQYKKYQRFASCNKKEQTSRQNRYESDIFLRDGGQKSRINEITLLERIKSRTNVKK